MANVISQDLNVQTDLHIRLSTPQKFGLIKFSGCRDTKKNSTSLGLFSSKSTDSKFLKLTSMLAQTRGMSNPDNFFDICTFRKIVTI